MQIKTAQTTEHILDIELPFFRKRVCGISKSVRYIGVLPDYTNIFIFQLQETTNIRHGKINDKLELQETEAYLLNDNWQPCDEADFLSFHMEALKSLSLAPTLVEKDTNDLKHVNI